MRFLVKAAFLLGVGCSSTAFADYYCYSTLPTGEFISTCASTYAGANARLQAICRARDFWPCSGPCYTVASCSASALDELEQEIIDHETHAEQGAPQN